MKSSLLLFLLPGTAWAVPCGPVPAALEVLNEVVGAFYQGADGASAYCPDDLNTALDLEEADRLAKAMDSSARSLAATQIGEAADGLEGANTQALANAAALLDALLGAELAADGDAAQAILSQIHAIAAGTDDERIHRQIGLNLWRRGASDSDSKDLLSKILPSKPDYDRVFKDGRGLVPVKLRTGFDGFAYAEFEEAFDVPGAELVEIKADKHIQVTYTVQPDDPTLDPVTWKIDIIRSPSTDHFDDMSTDDMSVTMFADHSQLGTSLDRALDNRPDGGQTSTDFFWVDACKSKVFASRLSQTYPMAHFVFTKESEYFRDMPVSFERGLVALANGYNYDEMRRLVAAGTTWQGKNYIFPDDPAKFAYQDQDGDGVTDSEDRLFNLDEQDGELATRAVTIANTYMGYSLAYQYFSARADVVVEDHYRPDGIFDGEPNGPVTRIETRTDVYGVDKHFVAVSDEALKMGQSQRTASIAAEMATHQGAIQGWSEDFAHAGAFLIGAAVYDVWLGDNFNEYRAQYFPEMELSDYESAKYLEDHKFVTKNGISALLSAVAKSNDD